MTNDLLEGRIKTDEALHLSGLQGEDALDLLACASQVSRRFKGSDVFTCVILNAKSGQCSQVCASLGELTGEMAAQLKQSGLTNYHHNLETAQSYFHEICTTHDYEEDIHTIKEAAMAGLRICSGGILGLGESWEQRIELSATLRDLDVDSIPVNFLNTIPGRIGRDMKPFVKPGGIPAKLNRLTGDGRLDKGPGTEGFRSGQYFPDRFSGYIFCFKPGHGFKRRVAGQSVQGYATIHHNGLAGDEINFIRGQGYLGGHASVHPGYRRYLRRFFKTMEFLRAHK